MSFIHILQGICAAFHPKLKKRVQGLKVQYRSENQIKSDKYRLLFHCASFGEYEQVKPLLRRIKSEYPEFSIVISFFSPSGFEMATVDNIIDEIYYLPIDTKRNMRRFIQQVSPNEVFFIKYEIWINFIHLLKQYKIPSTLISGRFYPTQIYFRWYGALFRAALRRLSRLFVQDDQSKKLLDRLGIKSVMTGDTRADRVQEYNNRVMPELEFLEPWKSDRPLLILGSIWPEDWKIFKPIVNQLIKHYHLLIVPHELDERFIRELELSIVGPVTRWTNLKEVDVAHITVLIMDTMGLLAASYRYGDVAYIGGAFKQGLHNVLEPAAQALPVVFGPQLEGFTEASDLVALNAGFTVQSAEELLGRLTKLLDPAFRHDAGQLAKDYIASSVGATDTIFAHLVINWKNV